jgi:glutathione S-transferase/GST-like protein
MVRDRDPVELRAALDRIPTPERRRAWEMAIYNLFNAEQLAESRRRVTFAARLIEEALSHTPWLAGGSYSLADIDGFNMCCAAAVAAGGGQ